MSITSLFTGHLWKIATGGAVILSLVLMSLLLSATFTNKDLTKQRNEMAQSINDPKTGYVALLSQARTNVATLRTQLEVQNVAIDKMSKESAAKLAESRRQLVLAQTKTAAMERQLGRFLATKPVGDTLEARIRDIDARAMKEFLQ